MLSMRRTKQRATIPPFQSVFDMVHPRCARIPPLSLERQPGKTALSVRAHPISPTRQPTSLTRAPHSLPRVGPKRPHLPYRLRSGDAPDAVVQSKASQQPSWCQSGRPYWLHLSPIGKSCRSGGRENPSTTPLDCLDGQSGAELMRTADRLHHVTPRLTLHAASFACLVQTRSPIR
jgi:hypothetical protein